MGIKIITVIHEQVDRVVILAPVWPILKFVQFIHQLTDTEPHFDPMHQLRFLVKDLDCWTFTGVVVPALSYQILIKIENDNTVIVLLYIPQIGFVFSVTVQPERQVASSSMCNDYLIADEFTFAPAHRDFVFPVS